MLCDDIQDVIYRFYLSRGIVNVSFQQTPCQKICKEYVLMSNLELRTPRKFYIRRNNNKVDSIETGHITTADLLP